MTDRHISAVIQLVVSRNQTNLHVSTPADSDMTPSAILLAAIHALQEEHDALTACPAHLIRLDASRAHPQTPPPAPQHPAHPRAPTAL